MRIAIAPDSFKECASSTRVAEAIAAGTRRACPEADLDLIPVADGGEGTVEALVRATGGRIVEHRATGPLGSPLDAFYGILGDGKTAVVETAAAAGLHRVPKDARDPRIATTRGTGELIRHALDAGYRRIIIALGGSATNDCGAGMAQALGYSLRDADGAELPPGGAALARLALIDVSSVHPALRESEIVAACDVDNPLCGPRGASRVYGPQKGATPDAVEELDAALQHAGEIIARDLDIAVLDVPGAGSAGGLGAGVLAFGGGKLRRGIEIVDEATGLEERLSRADLVITGEGGLDYQTAHGKTPVGVAQLAKRHGVPVVALAGRLGEGYRTVYEHGIDAAFAIGSEPMSLAEAIERVDDLLANAAEAAVRLFTAAAAKR
ncbi:MAG: glycerate kinase [FCB group bacterium]|jgi:glycerate kinase|nr:glycerate kinase [FCB group bacterium]